MAPSPETATAYLRREAAALTETDTPLTEPLDGAYARVHLSWLRQGLAPETLARLFCLSAQREPSGREALERKLAVGEALAEAGRLPCSAAEWRAAAAAWRDADYAALHHSERFRACYHPAYRVLSAQYLPFLPLLAAIDRRLESGRLTLAIEGGSASGKTTLGALLERVYGCTVFHMDDFFLRPEQRTAARYAEAGGNVDRERFLEEVLLPLHRGEAVTYRPFDCGSMTLGKARSVTPTRLTVVEGAYSMHPALAEHYGLSVFLSISPQLQRKRITARNSPQMAERFEREWIPLEMRYFEALQPRERCDLTVEITE